MSSNVIDFRSTKSNGAKRKVDKSKCADFDPQLEAKRDNYSQQILKEENPDDKREASRGLASLTAQRSPSFISELERLKGIWVDDE